MASSRIIDRAVGQLGACALVVATACAGLAVGAATAGASPKPHGSACPTTGGIPFTGTLTHGSIALGRAVSGSGLSGTVCGLLAGTSSGFSVTIPRAAISFAPTHVTILGLAQLPATVAAAGDGTGSVTVASGGSFDASISVPVTSTVSALGFACTVGPFTPVLTTGTSGSVSGEPLTGSLSSLTGRLAAGEFAVPPIAPSSSCPWFVAGLVNLISGLPLKAGASTLTASAALSVG